MNVEQSELLFSGEATKQSARPNVLSITEISQKLKRHIEVNFNRITIRGEVSGFKRHSSGHCYYTLKDQGAVIDAITWRGTRLNIELAEGLEIIATGKITTYPGRSKYQIVVDHAQISGEGALLKLLQERKEKFYKAGFFNQKRKLPLFPKKIGVVTSLTGAVIRDILHRLHDRFPTHVVVWPVLVQGPGASEQIAKAIDGFNQFQEAEKPDLLIIARGGGSLEDLWCFNEECVVRSVFASSIPTISAVGHETDVTLIDYAADLRAPTPTAAAEIATPVKQDLSQTLHEMENRLKHNYRISIERKAAFLRELKARLPQPIDIYYEKAQKLDDWADRLFAAMRRYCDQRDTDVKTLRLRFPNHLMQQLHRDLLQLNMGLNRNAINLYDKKATQLDHLANALAQSSFQKNLEKGFALIQSDRCQAIRSVDDLKHNQEVQFHLSDGKALAKILDITRREME